MNKAVFVVPLVLAAAAGAALGIVVWRTRAIIVAEPPAYETLLKADTTGQLRQQIFADQSEPRKGLVRLLEDGSEREPIRDAKVLAAVGRVPRHAFVVIRHRDRAYWDRAMPIELGQTISQPYVVALMTEMLALQPGAKVLEIGTGSGYQAAILAELAVDVFSIEILAPLATSAAERLHLLGYDAVQVRRGDGYFGWPEQAPFDGIIVTCAAGHIPPPLIEQLAKGGRMVIPVGDAYGAQRLILLTKDENGEVRTEDRAPVGFVPMTGAIETSR